MSPLNRINWALVLTSSRILLLPVVIAAFSNGKPVAALVILAIAALTDFADGQVARKFNYETALGALLDPAADKAFVISISWYLSTKGNLPAWYAVTVIARNMAQLLAIPVLGWILQIAFKVKPRLLPKIAASLCFAVLWFSMLGLLGNSESPLIFWLSRVNMILMFISIALEIYVLASYVPRFFQIATKQHDTFE